MAISAVESEVLVPASAEEAIEAFGDGSGVTVIAGGTIVMPEIAMGRLRPARTLLLARAGLDQLRHEPGTFVVGAAVSIAALVDAAPEPLASAARGVGDPEVRAQGTVGGNVCAPPGAESPRGDLQAALIALDARVRSAGAGGERTEPVEDFLESRDGRLVLEIQVDEPTRGSYAALGRPHAHAYTILAVAVAETGDGVRIGIAGAGPRGLRATSVEQALAGGASPQEAAATVLDDVDPRDDALASAWYRRKVLPGLVARALADLS